MAQPHRPVHPIHRTITPITPVSVESSTNGRLHHTSTRSLLKSNSKFGWTTTRHNSTLQTNLNTPTSSASCWKVASHIGTCVITVSSRMSSGMTPHNNMTFHFNHISIPSLSEKAHRRFPPPPTRATSTSPSNRPHQRRPHWPCGQYHKHFTTRPLSP